MTVIGLVNSYLIFRICQKVGVIWEQDEEILHSKVPFNIHSFIRLNTLELGPKLQPQILAQGASCQPSFIKAFSSSSSTITLNYSHIDCLERTANHIPIIVGKMFFEDWAFHQSMKRWTSHMDKVIKKIARRQGIPPNDLIFFSPFLST